MKIIFDYCRQIEPYRGSSGKCLIELEKDDNVDEIIKEFTAPKEWFEQKYLNPKRVSSYEYSVTNKKYEGDLLIFDTRRAYLD